MRPPKVCMPVARRLALGFTALALSALALAPRLAAADGATWVVGANVGNVPWEFQDAQGKFVGFEIDLITEVAKRAGKAVRFENIPFNGLFSAVQSGRIDIALSSITVTPRRLASLAFSQPFYDSDQSLSVLKTSKINGLDDLAGKVVGVDTASTGDMWATANMARYRLASISRYEGLAPAMLDLASGRIDVYISDLPAVAYFIKDKRQYRIAARVPTGEHYAFMHAKNFADAARLNDALSQLKKDGYVARLHQQWFGSEPPAKSSSVVVMDAPKR